MARQPEPEEKSAAPRSKRSSEEGEEASPPSHSHPLLKQVAHYAMLGIGPLLAILALIFALVSLTRISPIQAELADTEAKIKKLGADLASTQLELKKAKDALQQEKSAREDGSKKQDELAAKIVQNLAPLQTKLKISPTLEEQLRQPEGASAVPATTGNAAPAPAAAEQKKAEKPHSPQVKSMLDAIKKFNEQ